MKIKEKVGREVQSQFLVATWKQLILPTSASASVSHSQSEDAPPTADVGWALKKTKQSVHFTTKSLPVFLQGDDTGNKATTEDVAACMRSMRTTEGTKVHQR